MAFSLRAKKAKLAVSILGVCFGMLVHAAALRHDSLPFNECYLIHSSFIVACFLIILVVIGGLTYLRFSDKSPPGTPLRNIADFRRLMGLKTKEEDQDELSYPERSSLPFQLARYRYSKLYAHHRVITGYIEIDGGKDFLLTTIEYDVVPIWRRCRPCPKIFWGLLQCRVVRLSKLVTPDDTYIISTTPSNRPYLEKEFQNAMDLLWNTDVIKQVSKAIGDRSMTATAIQESLDVPMLNKALFIEVAKRARPLFDHDPIGWRLSYNNCEHLASYLLSGNRTCTQLEMADWLHRYILHSVGPILELVAFRVWFLILAHVIALLITIYFMDHIQQFMFFVPAIFTIEFLPVAWEMGSLLMSDHNSPISIACLCQRILLAVLCGLTFSVAVLLGHRTNCYPWFFDHFFAVFSFFSFCQFLIYPVFALMIDIAVQSRHSPRCRRALVMIPIVLAPWVIVCPFLYFLRLEILSERQPSMTAFNSTVLP